MNKVKRILVVGAGLTGLTTCWKLSQFGKCKIDLIESDYEIGGSLRSGEIGYGLMYEKFGAHISHTNNELAIKFLKTHSNWIDYKHIVKSQTDEGLLSWPPQISELKQLSVWSRIERELKSQPAIPTGSNFEEYCVNLMGKTIYELFIEGYTRKQWGQEAKYLSTEFAPKRIDLRSDNYTQLFRDKFQGWPKDGWEALINSILNESTAINEVKMGSKCYEKSVEWLKYDAVLVTAPLDEFLELEPLPWRGIRLEHVYYPKQRGFKQESGVINFPKVEVPWTRTIEAKWMSDQSNLLGTVISYEYPGASSKHYPVNDAKGENKKKAQAYRKILKSRHPNSYLAGRLANYVYIDTDQAIIQGFNAGTKIAKELGL